MDESPNYIPGVCNINTAEASYRKKAGWLGVYVGGTLVFALIFINFHPAFGVIMAIPTWLSALGFIQAKQRFCLSYAVTGKYNPSENYGEVGAVTLKQDAVKDLKRAKSLHIQAIAWGVAGGIFWTLVMVGIRLIR